jgi:hypothetical protein
VTVDQRARLREMWPSMTIRVPSDDDRTLFVISSMTVDVPHWLAPLVPSYEERYLFYVLGLLRAPRTKLVYVTSMPVLERLVDYELGLLRHFDDDTVRRRVTFVALGDPSPRPLTQKILERPRTIERLRALVENPARSLILPFVTSPSERALSDLLDVPVYGPDPDLAHLGSKSGGRRVFEAAGVPHPVGTEGLRDLDDVCAAIADIRRRRPDGRCVVLKLDDGFSGLGNATVDVRGADDRREIERRVRALQGEGFADGDAFLEALAHKGGIVEEHLDAVEVRSPSVQLRASPLGEVEVLSTHDQILGGADGQTYEGCRFPADDAYAAELIRLGRSVGEHLASAGAIGRFAIDFLATRDSPTEAWQLHGIEINLRNGGTTHPMLTLQALVDAPFDEESNSLRDARGTAKHYVATDHLHSPAYQRLTADDVIDLTERTELGWDPTSATGTALHMVSAVAVAGRLGLTAIGDSPVDAEARHRRFERALDDLCRASTP